MSLYRALQHYLSVNLFFNQLRSISANRELLQMKLLNILFRSLILTITVIFSCSVFAEAGRVTHLSGNLKAQNSAGEQRTLAIKSAIDEGDTLITSADSYARIKFIDGANLIIRPNSLIKIEDYRFDANKPEEDNVSVNLIKGSLRSITGLVGKRNSDRHRTRTVNATIGIRGTHFGLLLCQSANSCSSETNLSGDTPETGLHIDVLEGGITATNQEGEVEIQQGEFGYVASPTSAPVKVASSDGTRVPIIPTMVDPEASDDGC